ncbi:ATP phosphoribosyltransferase regulatory subunit [Solemya velum gill symbiont]|uniref:ATP phosphoribosyltransferase regulatory subunit n=1 Tax=Solemya velum gill symbiont TaxID=2340 RepID=UPI00117B4AA7|nr:ATP phosphoribosyltransferase regulatory subunit [Solemya velum gill symbiont]
MKRQNEHWLLPEGIDELLPPQAEQVEQLRRQLLDLYHSWGYQLVMPPLVEYVESLLTGTGADLDLKTFKLTDQLSGRMMGLRADMTPQVARIDAHKLCSDKHVLWTRPDGFGGSRSPLQVGAELFGHDGVASDVEVLTLMLETLKAAGLPRIHFDLGHVGIYRGLVEQAGISSEDEMVLFDALQRKALPEIESLIAELELDSDMADMLLALPSLSGDISTLDDAKNRLAKASPEVKAALENLEQIATAIASRVSEASVHIDIAELRAYHYQTGIVFAAFAPGSGTEIARGGRYNDIGRAFGRARPATGFSTDLRVLSELGSVQQAQQPTRILAPWGEDAELLALVNSLRQEGRIVIQELPGQDVDMVAMECGEVIRKTDAGWRVEKGN